MNIPWVRLYEVDFIVGQTPWSAAGPLASLLNLMSQGFGPKAAIAL